jgi:hypothetical protein
VQEEEERGVERERGTKSVNSSVVKVHKKHKGCVPFRRGHTVHCSKISHEEKKPAKKKKKTRRPVVRPLQS